MNEYKLEILNPKALQLIKDMEELELVRISQEPVSALQSYLKRMRQHSASAPGLDEITLMVEEVRSARYAKK